MIPFSLLSLGWSGKGELPVLTQAEHDGPVRLLRGRHRLCGFYANELLSKLLHRHDPHAGLFDAYDRLTEVLDCGQDIEANLRLFEKKLVQELGYALELEHEADGKTRVDPVARYQYVPMYGAVRVEERAGDYSTVCGATLLAFASEKLTDEWCLEECKMLMRGVISHHLGQRKLQVRSLFKCY